MNASIFRNCLLAVTVLVTFSLSAHAQVAGLYITEVNAGGSSATYAADWFELTNTTGSAIDITGWKMDDSSSAFATSATLNGITSIGAGQSVIFLENTNIGIDSLFNTAWGTSLVYGTNLGIYNGSSIGLSTSGDGVSLFDSAGALQLKVSFGAATAPKTFDNAALLNNTTISQLSAAGINGAFTGLNGEIGSPGYAPIPEPSTYALVLGLGAMGFAARRRRVASAA